MIWDMSSASFAMLLTPQLCPAELREAVMRDQLGGRTWARVKGYWTECRVSNMPPIQRRVLILMLWVSVLLGSKAHIFGGT